VFQTAEKGTDGVRCESVPVSHRPEAEAPANGHTKQYNTDCCRLLIGCRFLSASTGHVPSEKDSADRDEAGLHEEKSVENHPKSPPGPDQKLVVQERIDEQRRDHSWRTDHESLPEQNPSLCKPDDGSRSYEDHHCHPPDPESRALARAEHCRFHGVISRRPKKWF